MPLASESLPSDLWSFNSLGSLNMKKESLCASKIQDIVQRKLDLVIDNTEDQRTVFAMPYWHAEDDQGCNWNISTIKGNAALTEKAIEIIGQARMDYFLMV